MPRAHCHAKAILEPRAMPGQEARVPELQNRLSVAKAALPV